MTDGHFEHRASGKAVPLTEPKRHVITNFHST